VRPEATDIEALYRVESFCDFDGSVRLVLVRYPIASKHLRGWRLENGRYVGISYRQWAWETPKKALLGFLSGKRKFQNQLITALRKASAERFIAIQHKDALLAGKPVEASAETNPKFSFHVNLPEDSCAD
jgi:hypothetical protein